MADRASVFDGAFRLRPAAVRDREALARLIEVSARELCAADYTPAQIEGALAGAFGVDSQLVADGTYFVVEASDEASDEAGGEDGAAAGRLVACGGWSFRRTLFGGDAEGARDATALDPAREAAKIRAFFVDPAYARRGLGRRLLERCEAEARSRGFTRFELMATRTGARLYERFGYRAGEPVDYGLGGGLTIDFVPMSKP